MMTISRRIAFTALAAPLALAIGACSDTAEGDVAATEAFDAVPAPEGQEWTDVVEVTDYDGYLLGNPDAPIKLVEYGSLTCGACANFAQTGADQLKEDYVNSGIVSFELRNQVHNAFDLTLAALARCSAPESFHPLADQVWKNFDTVMGQMQQAQGQLANVGQLPEDQRFVAIADAAGFLDFFAARGISRDQARACLADSEEVLAIGTRSDEQSTELGVDSTPTFILNDRVLDERSWDDLEAVLQTAGARPVEG
ncbi:thioredoxin domain-containing protein [Aurantiacibacter poecillastricola]|uniref:thioredoxin domain-containing protein n=1 Tax=Aurantiacibacter poecillastricola TaxID=3064385 RepID=UPI00273E7F6F|nr:thioredoxin domain-containing protein [Aurantiacibacter sp. 219JJ12-13]MDP5261515.1 thioredoxin domain-containing protein [Aurantiacibacter sp. 219JJ12-13]